MQITLELPDEIGAQPGKGRDLSRAGLEALIADSCREKRLSEHQAASILGMGRYELDGLLKRRGVYYDLEINDFREQCARVNCCCATGSHKT